MDNFCLAAIPEPFTILGKRLEPLSIGHLLALERFGCDPVVTLDQLIQAVIICSRPPDQIPAAFSDRWLRFKLWFWAWRLGKFNPADKIDLFHEYLHEHTRHGPEIMSEEDETGGPTCGAPWLQHVKVTLTSKIGYSPAEALAAPYAVAIWDYYTYWESEGRADIYGEQRQRMHDLANAMHEQTLASVANQRN